MQESDTILTQLRELFVCQHLAVLATDDLRGFFLATKRGTLKFANTQSNSHVALLIDNRANSATLVRFL